MKKALVMTVLALALGGTLSASETTKNLDLAAQGIKRLEIRAGAGSLTVTGRDGMAAIEVKAEIAARHVRDDDMERFIKDRVELTLEKRGDVAVLVSRVRDSNRIFSFGDDGQIDLTVSVPKDMALDIDDGSGGIVVEDLAAAVRIEDGSGSIRVSRVRGDVRIDDGSGGIEVREVTGDVSIDDGSGEILIRRVGGGVTVDDGSGDIDIEDVEKDIRLINTGSGDVRISGEKGRVIRAN